MFIASDEIKALRKACHCMLQEMRECSICLDTDKVEEYSQDLNDILNWVDKFEVFFYG